MGQFLQYYLDQMSRRLSSEVLCGIHTSCLVVWDSLMLWRQDGGLEQVYPGQPPAQPAASLPLAAAAAAEVGRRMEILGLFPIKALYKGLLCSG